MILFPAPYFLAPALLLGACGKHPMCRIVHGVARLLSILLQPVCGVAAAGKCEQVNAGEGDCSFCHQVFPGWNGDQGKMMQSPAKSIRGRLARTASGTQWRHRRLWKPSNRGSRHGLSDCLRRDRCDSLLPRLHARRPPDIEVAAASQLPQTAERDGPGSLRAHSQMTDKQHFNFCKYFSIRQCNTF